MERKECTASGFVLAGGQSSRMGSDKALVEFRGQPLVVHALRILQEAGLKVAIAGARSTLAGFAPVVEDEEKGRGPLAGICAALAQTDADLAVFLPVDMVVMPSSLVRLLLDTAKQSGAAITLAAVNGRVETFPVVICRKTLGVLKRELAAGRGGCLRAFEAVAAAEGSAVHFVEVAGAPGPSSWFLNLNTRQDVERAEELSASDPV